MENQQLSRELVDFLQGEKIISLITINKETKQPTVSIISWLLAHKNGRFFTFAVGHNADSTKNIEEDPYVVLNIIAENSTFEVTGEGKVSNIYKGTIKYRVVTVEIKTVKENMFYGGKITTFPQYEKTYDLNLAKKLDHEIYVTLKEILEKILL